MFVMLCYVIPQNGPTPSTTMHASLSQKSSLPPTNKPCCSNPYIGIRPCSLLYHRTLTMNQKHDRAERSVSIIKRSQCSHGTQADSAHISTCDGIIGMKCPVCTLPFLWYHHKPCMPKINATNPPTQTRFAASNSSKFLAIVTDYPSHPPIICRLTAHVMWWQQH